MKPWWWALLFVAAAAGVGLWLLLPRGPLVSDAGTQEQTPSGTTVYENDAFGFSLTIPASWTAAQQTTNTNSAITNFTFQNAAEGMTLIIAPEALESVFFQATSIEDQETVVAAGETATRLKGAATANGTRLDLLLFKRNGNIYAVNGTADLIDSVGMTFRFTQ